MGEALRDLLEFIYLPVGLFSILGCLLLPVIGIANAIGWLRHRLFGNDERLR